VIRRLAAVLIAAAAAACSGSPVCGVGDAGGGELGVTAGAEALAYADFTSSANNDCPADGAPTSLTVDGRQTTATSFHLTLCLPHPDQIGDQPIPLSRDDLVQVINVNGQLAASCLLVLDSTAPRGGASIQFSGYCGDGLDPGGYRIAMTGTLPGTRVCPGPDGSTSEPIDIDLSGDAAVSAL